jgi:hypothetical protein
MPVATVVTIATSIDDVSNVHGYCGWLLYYRWFSTTSLSKHGTDLANVNMPVVAVARQRRASRTCGYCATLVATGCLPVATMPICSSDS